MLEYTFEVVWVHKILEGTHEIEITVEAHNEQDAYERAFERAMKIHKNMIMSSPNFSEKWEYGGIHLMYFV